MDQEASINPLLVETYNIAYCICGSAQLSCELVNLDEGITHLIYNRRLHLYDKIFVSYQKLISKTISFSVADWFLLFSLLYYPFIVLHYECPKLPLKITKTPLACNNIESSMTSNIMYLTWFEVPCDFWQTLLVLDSSFLNCSS